MRKGSFFTGNLKACYGSTTYGIFLVTCSFYLEGVFLNCMSLVAELSGSALGKPFSVKIFIGIIKLPKY